MANNLDALGFKPIDQSRLAAAYRVLRNEFDDGYGQRAGGGLNSRVDRWRVVYRETPSQIDSIVAVIDAAAGVEVITWTAVRGTTAQKWTCEGFDRSYGATYDMLTLTLRQEFDL